MRRTATRSSASSGTFSTRSLLAAVYYVLVVVLSGGQTKGPDFFAHLLAGLFAFYFVSGCMAGGASSVTSAGKIIMNTAFPRILVVFSAVFIAFRKFLPTMLVYIPVALITGVGIPWTAPLAVLMFCLLIVFGMGMALLLATAQVCFHEHVQLPAVPHAHLALRVARPLVPRAGEGGSARPRDLQPAVLPDRRLDRPAGQGGVPPWTTWAAAAAWAFGTLLVGAIVFMSRERDFAVRL